MSWFCPDFTERINDSYDGGTVDDIWNRFSCEYFAQPGTQVINWADEHQDFRSDGIVRCDEHDTEAISSDNNAEDTYNTLLEREWNVCPTCHDEENYTETRFMYRSPIALTEHMANSHADLDHGHTEPNPPPTPPAPEPRETNWFLDVEVPPDVRVIINDCVQRNHATFEPGTPHWVYWRIDRAFDRPHHGQTNHHRIIANLNRTVWGEAEIHYGPTEPSTHRMWSQP